MTWINLTQSHCLDNSEVYFTPYVSCCHTDKESNCISWKECELLLVVPGTYIRNKLHMTQFSSLNIRLHSSVRQFHVFLDSYKHLRSYAGNHLPDYMASQPGRPVLIYTALRMSNFKLNVITSVPSMSLTDDPLSDAMYCCTIFLIGYGQEFEGQNIKSL